LLFFSTYFSFPLLFIDIFSSSFSFTVVLLDKSQSIRHYQSGRERGVAEGAWLSQATGVVPIKFLCIYRVHL
jgi:hypothetical protein